MAGEVPNPEGVVGGEEGVAKLEAFLRSRDPATRKRAVKLLTADLDAVLLSHGFQRKGGRWRRTGRFATTFVEIQRSRYGEACFINVGRDGPDPDWRQPSYRNNTHWRISEFAPTIAEGNRIDRMPYADLIEPMPFREPVVALVRDEAVPFLDRAQGASGALARPASRGGTLPNGASVDRTDHFIRSVLFGASGRRPRWAGYALFALFWAPMVAFMAFMTTAWAMGCQADGVVAGSCAMGGMEVAPLVRALTTAGWQAIVVFQIVLVLAVVGVETLARRLRR